MKLQEFFTNEKDALNGWPETELAPKPNEAKVLGIKWTTDQDFLHFKYPLFTGKISKRRVLSTIAQVFDPLGLLSPTLLTAKLFMRKLHEAKLNWDQEMDPELQMEWKAIMRTWQTQTGDPLTIHFPRYIPSIEGMDQLHCFADASGHGIGVAIYQRSIGNNEKAEINLIFAKALVKPAKLADQVATIPKMELQALTLGTKISKLIQSQLEINNEQITLWSDSQCSIDRIKGNLKQDRFVTNRINKIRGNYKVKHVKSEDNPADIASRGMDPALLNCSLMWRHGPIWLAKPEEKWPEPIVQYSPEAAPTDATENDEEMDEATDNTLFELSMPATNVTFKGIDTTKFNTWLILKRAITNAFRFIKKVSRNYEAKEETLKKVQLTSKTQGPITANEMKFAENFLYKQAQKQQPPTDVQKRDLNLYQEEGI
jgi:ribonuclease HI